MSLEIKNLSFNKEKRNIIESGITFAPYGIPLHFEVKGEEIEKPIDFSFTCLFDKNEDPCAAKFESTKKEELNIKFYNPGLGLNMPDSALGIEISPNFALEFIFSVDTIKINTKIYRLSYEFSLIKK